MGGESADATVTGENRTGWRSFEHTVFYVNLIIICRAVEAISINRQFGKLAYIPQAEIIRID